MKVEQIAIFLENKSGRLADISHTLSEHNINIRALSLADTADFGILRLVVNDTEKAKKFLKENGFTVGIAEVLAVEVPDRPGGLDSILQVIKKAEMNVEYMYAFTRQSGNSALLIFRFDDIDTAIKVFQAANIRILSGKEVNSL
jgi:hypothetical protein